MSLEVRLARYPDGVPEAEDFALARADASPPKPGEVTVDVEWLSMDPVTRVRMAAASAMGPPMVPGSVVAGRGVGRVAVSNADGFAPGTPVYGEFGWRARATVPAAACEPLPATDLALHHHLNALGPSGLAAWFAVDALAPAPGETFVIAPAAGAVGGLALQLARAAGANVIGIGTGRAQRAWLAAQGVTALDAADDLAPHLAGGVNLFLDGVGCDLHERVIAHLAPRARVLLLGFVAGYGRSAPPRYGSMLPILMRRATVTGFLLADHMTRANEARSRLAEALASGALVPCQTVWDGLSAAPAAFAALFGDAPPGKQIVRITEEDR